ncbi:MAG: hypothetical protein ACRYFS_06785 [Janthinobacterium lividum]
MIIFRAAIIFFCLSLSMAVFASSHHRYHHHSSSTPPVPPQVILDLTPVAVQPYVLPVVTNNPVQASFLHRMNLENGVEVRSTRWIETPDVTTRNLFILSVTQSLEGGFDSVNMYDKGVLSWGIMQWTAGTGSLPPVLIYIKRRLMATGQERVWNKVFIAQGLDVDGRGLIAYGKPLSTSDDMRLAFRGSVLPGNYDPKVVTYWATVMARAGRQPAIQQYQREYAQQVVDDLLTQSVPGPNVTVSRLSGGDPYAEALAFALWTNNPRHAQEYLADAAQAARHTTGQANPALWGPETFREALLSRCHVSRFGNWKVRAAMIETREQALHTSLPAALTPYEQACQIALVSRKTHLLQLASRHKPTPPRSTVPVHPPQLSRRRPAKHGILTVS